jgi:hypothetical protein
MVSPYHPRKFYKYEFLHGSPLHILKKKFKHGAYLYTQALWYINRSLHPASHKKNRQTHRT